MILRILFSMILIAVVTFALHFVFPKLDLMVLWVIATAILFVISLLIGRKK